MTKKVLYTIKGDTGQAIDIMGDVVNFDSLSDNVEYKESNVDLKPESINLSLENQDFIKYKPEVIKIGSLDDAVKVSGWYIEKENYEKAKDISDFLGGVDVKNDFADVFLVFEKDRIVSLDIANYPHKRLGLEKNDNKKDKKIRNRLK